MRIVGPRHRFELLRRIEGEISADGQKAYWRRERYIHGIFVTVSGKESRYYDKIGVEASHRFYINGCDISEKDRLKKDDTEYNILFVDNKFLKNKILVVDLVERKE